MSFYNLFVFIVLIIFPIQNKQFVKLNDSNVRISQEENIYTIVLPFKIVKGYHIQSERDIKDNLIATEITFENNKAFEIINYNFTLKHYETVVLNQFTHNVLSNKVEVTIVLKLNDRTQINSNYLKGQLYYQACDDRQCFFPRALNFIVNFNN